MLRFDTNALLALGYLFINPEKKIWQLSILAALVAIGSSV